MTQVAPGLDQLEGVPREQIGGKAFNLGHLVSAGFEVPPGIVLLATTPFDDPSLAAALSRVGAGPFAVRSSGGDEDGADGSLAGMFRSILEVQVADVPSAVEECRQAARDVSGIDNDPGQGQVAVVIQEMVSAKVAGAAFSADPVTGDRETTVITATHGLADRLLAGEVNGDEWEVESGTPRERHHETGALSPWLASRVADLAAGVATEFDRPVDIEWAWDGETLWLLQARPITGLPREVSWETTAPGVYHRGFRFGEWMPGPVSTLFEDWMLSVMEHRLHELHLAEIGQTAPEPLHVVVNGWYFYSLNFLPVPGASLLRSLPGIIRCLFSNPRRVAVMFPQTARFGYPVYEDEWRCVLLPRYRQATKDAEASVEFAPPEKLIDMIDQLSKLAGEYFASVTVVAGSAYKLETQLARFWSKHLSEVGDSHMSLLQGLQSPDGLQAAPMIESLDLYHPPLSADPPKRPAGPDLVPEREQKTAEAVSALRNSPRKAKRFCRLLDDAQHLVPVREQQLAELTLPWPVLRRATLRLGHHLVATGSIDEPDDVFFLTKAEIEDQLDSSTAMQATVRRRKDDFDAAKRLSPPLMVGKAPLAIRLMFSTTNRLLGSRPNDRSLLNGVPASPGRASGPVRIVRGAADFDRFKEGEVLVAPLTAPAWTTLFGRAAAVITDVGSGLAHASIIAREYGLPAVVGCGNATQVLTDGQIVTVDGSTGTIERHWAR